MALAELRGDLSPDLPIAIERASAEPLGAQLLRQLRAAIADGVLAPGVRLPATRTLARELGVSRNVVVAAYDELLAEGFVAGRHGSGTYVEATLPTRPRAISVPPTALRWQRHPGPPASPPFLPDDDAPGLISFRPGVPALGLLPPEVWRRAWRAATDSLPPNRYAPAAGDQELRAALARWIGQTRGVACGPEDVIVTTGAAQSLDLIARATLGVGDAVAFEEPGYFSARNLLLAHGARIVPIPVDGDGMRVDLLPRGPGAPLLACVTPSHQYPLGGRLPIARRLALLDWARAEDSLIVEDDYDSEFRFDAPPLPALLSLDQGGRVVYVGTFAKSLTPTLRVGYLVAPPALRERIVALKTLIDRHTSWPIQRAVLALLTEGQIERHIRRARRRYGESLTILRAALSPVVAESAPIARLLGLEAGLHACLELDPALDAERIVLRARERGVVVGSLAPYYFGAPDRSGLVLGYGGLGLPELARGARILAEAIAAESRR